MQSVKILIAPSVSFLVVFASLIASSFFFSSSSFGLALSHCEQNISEIEKAAWDHRVDVYFQEKAWADSKFLSAWTNKTLADYIRDHPKKGVRTSFTMHVYI